MPLLFRLLLLLWGLVQRALRKPALAALHRGVDTATAGSASSSGCLYCCCLRALCPRSSCWRGVLVSACILNFILYFRAEPCAFPGWQCLLCCCRVRWQMLLLLLLVCLCKSCIGRGYGAPLARGLFNGLCTRGLQALYRRQQHVQHVEHVDMSTEPLLGSKVEVRHCQVACISTKSTYVGTNCTVSPAPRSLHLPQ